MIPKLNRCERKKRIGTSSGPQWLMPIILATWEAEIRRIEVPSQPRQIVLKTQS
jgi:hypothetical protein